MAAMTRMVGKLGGPAGGKPAARRKSGRADNALQALELTVLLDRIQNPVFIKDNLLRFLFVNKAYETMFNVKRKDVVGKSVLDMPYLSGEDRLSYQREDGEVVRSQKSKRHIFKYLYKGKHEHTCIWQTSGFTQGNGARGLIGTIVDINRQSETIRDLRKKLHAAMAEKKAATGKARIDPLTGLYARGVFDETLRRLASSGESAFSCVMLDIDCFKQVNDSFGHVAGDATLREVGGVLKKCTRRRDMAFRYGGDEFAVLLTGGGLDDSATLAERIRRRVCRNVRTPDGKRVTISAGCSEYRAGEAGSPVVQRADRALYNAKGSGRNRVCAHGRRRTTTLYRIVDVS